MRPLPLRPLTLSAVATLLVTGPASNAGSTSYGALDDPSTRVYVAPTAAARPTPFPTTGLATGSAPHIAYATATKPEFGEGDWRLHRPDGTVLALPRLTWGEWAPMGRGAIGMAGTERGPELQRVSGTGRVTPSFVAHFGLTVSPDHRIVGWLGDARAPRVVEGGGARHFALSRVPHGRSIGAVWGSRTCQEQAPEGGGCTVFVNGKRHVFVSTSHGIVERVGPMLGVADVSARGRVIGLVSRRTKGSRACWGVFTPAPRRVFTTCAYRLASFSTDGRRELAVRAPLTAGGVTRFAILGRSGHAVRAWSFDPGRHRTLSQLTWEDGHHLLGVLQSRGHWSVVRIGTDGSVEYAVAPGDATPEFSPYNLPLR
jgi:hypothetical protein